MVDQEDTQGIGMLIGSNIQAMKIQRGIAVDTREILDGEPLDARGEWSRFSSINDGDAVLALTSPDIEMINTVSISF